MSDLKTVTSTKKPWRFRKAFRGVLMVVLPLVGAVPVLCGSTRPALETETPTAPPTIVAPSVHAIGRLEPMGTVLRLAPPSQSEGARIERLLVSEGDTVTEGAIVALLDSVKRREAAVAEAEARLKAARAKLEQIRAGAKAAELTAQRAAMNRADVALRNAERELNRTESLAKRGVSTQESWDEAMMKRDSARLDVEQQRAALLALSEIRQVDIALQTEEIHVAEATLLRARADLGDAQVRAPVAGRVLKLHARPGERIGDRGILELGATHAMQAVAEVYEADVPRVRPGQKARVRLVSSGIEIEGRVERVGLIVGRKDVLDNDPVSDTDARVVEVRISLDPQQNDRVAGLSNARVDAHILVD